MIEVCSEKGFGTNDRDKGTNAPGNWSFPRLHIFYSIRKFFGSVPKRSLLLQGSRIKTFFRLRSKGFLSSNILRIIRGN